MIIVFVFFWHRPTMNRLCVIRDSSPNQYMLLITFKDKVSLFCSSASSNIIQTRWLKN
jgi:hypothetical protein